MFDYLAVLISVILGLALTQVLRGCSKLIQQRHTVKVYWVQVVWALNIAIYVLGIWWGMFWWRRLQVWTIEEFLFLTGYAIVLFMWASILFPIETPDGVDHEGFFFENRRWFFGIQTLAFIMDVPETLAKGVAHLRDTPPQYVAFIGAALTINVIGLATANRRVHAVLCLAWLALVTSYLGLTTLAKIVVA